MDNSLDLDNQTNQVCTDDKSAPTITSIPSNQLLEKTSKAPVTSEESPVTNLNTALQSETKKDNQDRNGS